ncbi:unnamed protein product [Rhizophagus irregularis]|nr:unnamed protein product [Rhizophagus irregularis]
MFLELGDPDITIDLREHNSGKPNKYDTFWKIAAQFLEGKAADAITAVDERRHDTIVHLVTAISVNDLLHQIERECPPETPIPYIKYFENIIFVYLHRISWQVFFDINWFLYW